MKVYVVVDDYLDCNERVIRTFESKKDAQDFVVQAYIEDHKFWGKESPTKEDVDSFREELERENNVHLGWEADYSIFETNLQFEKGEQE